MGCKAAAGKRKRGVLTATAKNEEREKGKSFRTIRIICTDPDATDDSSSDEKSPSSKRIVREIHLNLKNTASKISNPYPGVHLRKSGRWSSEITDRPNNRRIWLGTFETPEEALEANLAKKNELAASKRGMVSSSQKKRNKEIDTQVKKSPVYNEEIVGVCENWVKTPEEGDMVASHRKRNEVVSAYANWVKTQMGIGAKESERESMNESPSSVLPDVYDEVASSESVSYKEIDLQIRKPVYSEELVAASKNLQKTQLGIGGASESGSESVKESFSSVLDKSTEDVNEEGHSSEGSLMGKVLPASSCEDDNFLLRLGGPVIIDNHGSILGEFSWLDDLRICDNEDAN